MEFETISAPLYKRSRHKKMSQKADLVVELVLGLSILKLTPASNLQVESATNVTPTPQSCKRPLSLLWKASQAHGLIYITYWARTRQVDF